MMLALLTQRKRSACLIPRTPALDDAGKEDLLRVVSNVWPEAINDPAEIPVATSHDIVGGHVCAQGFKDVSEGGMEEFAPELAELSIVGVLLICWDMREFVRLAGMWRLILSRRGQVYLLFGIARKPRSVMALRCERRMLLVTSPLVRYNG